MKIAIITDIHGNAHALEAVLQDIDNHDITHIYCLGDMIGIGPDTNAVLDMLFSREDVSMITGNHDEAILALAKGEAYPKSHAHVRAHHQWIANRIEQPYIEKLSKLPRMITENIEQNTVRFLHYAIADGKLEAPISEDPFAPILDPSLRNMEVLFQTYEEDLIVFGHHHPKHYFKNDKTTYLNPGALGCQHQPVAPYAIVEFSGRGFEAEVVEVPYDNRAFLASYHELEVPDKDIILKIFHGNQI
ncbi:metallophosphoesterase family protein [Thalassobacillus hwangdonensis]|uniref:Metallophosphoesterase family protein n=1 Tax=Thalassobacillus hwangdonensis TaxID=546108 RepID=A0ABW3L134_9BACI